MFRLGIRSWDATRTTDLDHKTGDSFSYQMALVSVLEDDQDKGQGEGRSDAVQWDKHDKRDKHEQIRRREAPEDIGETDGDQNLELIMVGFECWYRDIVRDFILCKDRLFGISRVWLLVRGF